MVVILKFVGGKAQGFFSSVLPQKHSETSAPTSPNSDNNIWVVQHLFKFNTP